VGTITGLATVATSGAYADLTGRPTLGTAAAANTGDFAPIAHVSHAADSALRDRSTHTGTQIATTISDLTSATRAQVEAAVIAGSNITITPAGSGDSRTLTFASTASGGGGGHALQLTDRQLSNMNAQSGTWIHNGLDEPAGTFAAAANRLEIYPIMFKKDVTINRVGIQVTTGVVNGKCCVCIYSANQTTGRPDTELVDTVEMFTNSTTDDSGKYVDVSMTFTANTIYWVGTYHNSNATLRAYAANGVLGWSGTTLASTGHFNALRRTITYANGSPNTWVWNSAEQVRSTPHSVRFRVA
jgi:hypothetical protein